MYGVFNDTSPTRNVYSNLSRSVVRNNNTEKLTSKLPLNYSNEDSKSLKFKKLSTKNKYNSSKSIEALDDDNDLSPNSVKYSKVTS
jgi:hypothetical protein